MLDVNIFDPIVPRLLHGRAKCGEIPRPSTLQLLLFLWCGHDQLTVLQGHPVGLSPSPESVLADASPAYGSSPWRVACPSRICQGPPCVWHSDESACNRPSYSAPAWRVGAPGRSQDDGGLAQWLPTSAVHHTDRSRSSLHQNHSHHTQSGPIHHRMPRNFQSADRPESMSAVLPMCDREIMTCSIIIEQIGTSPEEGERRLHYFPVILSKLLLIQLHKPLIELFQHRDERIRRSLVRVLMSLSTMTGFTIKMLPCI